MGGGIKLNKGKFKMKKNELKAIERALNKKSEESVVDIANEIGEDLLGTTTNIITHHLLIL